MRGVMLWGLHEGYAVVTGGLCWDSGRLVMGLREIMLGLREGYWWGYGRVMLE